MQEIRGRHCSIGAKYRYLLGEGVHFDKFYVKS